MSLAVVQIASVAASSGGTALPAVAMGAPVTAGNLLVYAVFAASNPVVRVAPFPATGQNGWTSAGISVGSLSGSSNGQVEVFTRTALMGDGTTPPSPYSSGNYSTYFFACIQWEVSGVTGGIDAANSSATMGTTGGTTASLTSGHAAELALLASCNFGILPTIAPSGSPGTWTVDGTENGYTPQIAWAHQAIPLSGSTVDAAISGSGDDFVYFQMLLEGTTSATETANPVTLALSGVSFNVKAQKYSEGGPVSLALTGVAFKINTVDVTAEPSLVNFYTF